ncbi:MAG: DUF177 domain-containing protein [Acidobacteriota bacterium]
MEIRLDQIGDEQFRWREGLTLTDEELGATDLLTLGEIDCRGTVDTTTSGYVLRMSLAYGQAIPCVRCLETLDQQQDVDVDLLLEVGGDTAAEDEVQLDREDLGIVQLDEPVLDTRPMIIEQVQLGIPMKPLCRRDCAGLCSQCGMNLNEERCSCEAVGDPRWSALAALKTLEN